MNRILKLETIKEYALIAIATILFQAVVRILAGAAQPAGAAAADPAGCPQRQAGLATVTIGEDGYDLTLVELDKPFCQPFSVAITPQGSGAAAQSATDDAAATGAAASSNQILAEFDVQQYFVDTYFLNNFIIGTRGRPGATVIYQWVAEVRTQ